MNRRVGFLSNGAIGPSAQEYSTLGRVVKDSTVPVTVRSVSDGVVEIRTVTMSKQSWGEAFDTCRTPTTLFHNN